MLIQSLKKSKRKKAKNREKDSQRVQKDLQIHPPKEEIAEKGAERRFKEKDHYQGRNNRNIFGRIKWSGGQQK